MTLLTETLHGTTGRTRPAVLDRNHRAAPRATAGLTIRVSSGVGSGPTPPAAFDRALGRAGVGNYNLIRLTSMIPPGSQVIHGGSHLPRASWGDRVYAVYADATATIPSEEAWAGLAWAQDPQTGRGVIAWQGGGSEEKVRRGLEDSLRAMIRSRGELFGPIITCVAGGRYQGEPIAAVVIATFCSAPWSRSS